MRPDDPRRPDLRRSLTRAFRQYQRGENSGRSFWKSLSVLGSIGWPIVAFTAGGALLGHWLDQRYHTGNRWALMLVMTGVLLGSWTAWHSMRSER